MPDSVRTRVCVAGGGPAGIMLGLLLGRAGIDVVVLEKHADFFRDFRGDTVHPSTLNLIDQLGIRGEFEAIPHAPLTRLDAVVNGVRLHAIDFTRLPAPNRQVTLMPQWDLLDLLAREARRAGSFRLVMDAAVTGVRHAAGRVAGAIAQTPNGPLEIDADLTIAADGRESVVRAALGLQVHRFGVPIDVAWFRLARPAQTLPDTLGYLGSGTVMVTIPRPDYLQCGLLVAKGAFPQLRAEGIQALRSRIADAAPPLAEAAEGLASFDEVKLLSVQLDRLEEWSRPGALCLGDAAHAMSPVFGVGINFAFQDAVAAANLLVPVLRRGGAYPQLDAAVGAVQRRRARPTAIMQALQQRAHRILDRGVNARLLHNPPTTAERAALAALLPMVRRIAPRIVGYGFRPERIAAGVLAPLPRPHA